MTKDQINANMNILCQTHGIDYTKDSEEAFKGITSLEDKIPEDLQQTYWDSVDRKNISYNWFGPAEKRAKGLVEIFALISSET
jgi:hypothetical protein